MTVPGPASLSLVQSDPLSPSSSLPPWIGSCEKVYLDLGTNIGVQIRKLFEPLQYDGPRDGRRELSNHAEPFFASAFGEPGSDDRNRACAIGMEPNPGFATRLDALERSYREQGWRVHILKAGILGGSDQTGGFSADEELGGAPRQTGGTRSASESSGGVARAQHDVAPGDVVARGSERAPPMLMRFECPDSEHQCLGGHLLGENESPRVPGSEIVAVPAIRASYE